MDTFTTDAVLVVAAGEEACEALGFDGVGSV
jgi:hypothetical protein